ncbi:cupin domain-containing protein [Pseudovibrio denitrificans]|uniref:cupin domain-containing protein n=1 Tax=Pseudovibrio denitrificans TaxID=258256 RepID=UPI0039BEE0AB
MTLFDHNTQALEEWRDGVMTQMRISALNGSHQLCVFEQWCEPGKGARLHRHAVEELIDIMDGVAEFTCGDAKHVVSTNQSVLIPAGCLHGFSNVGDRPLHLRATLAAPVFEARYEDEEGITLRWLPDDNS